MKYDKSILADRLDIIDQIDFYKLNGIKIGSALSDIGSVTDDRISYKSLIKQYILNMFEFSYIAEKHGNGKILFFYSNENRTRPYVHQKMKNVEQLTDNKVIVKPNRRRPHLSGFFGMFYITKWKTSLKKSGFTTKESLFFAIQIYHAYVNLVELLKSSNYCLNDINLIVSVHDNRMADSVAIQYFNLLGKNTCTLQHGELLPEDLWLDAGKSFSKYFTVYGELAASRASKFLNHNNEIVRLGMPQMIGKAHEILEFKNMRTFGVYLDFIAFSENNVPMIKLANQIAEKFNLTYFIKYHPSLRNISYSEYVSEKCINEYRNDVSANDLVKDIDFALVCMSSMFGELLYQGLPTFRFISSEKDMYAGIEQLKISTIEDFGKYYDMAINSVTYEEMEQSISMICGLDDPAKKYTDFLKGFAFDE